MSENAEVYNNIRDVLGWTIQRQIVDVTQKDPNDEGEPYVMFMFDNGGFVKIPITERGFYCYVVTD